MELFYEAKTNNLEIDINTGIVSINNIIIPLKEYDWKKSNAIIPLKSFIESIKIPTEYLSDYRINIDCIFQSYKVRCIIERSYRPTITIIPTDLPKHANDIDAWSGLRKDVNDYNIQQAENWVAQVFGKKKFDWGTIIIKTEFDPHYASEPIYKGIMIVFD